MASNVLLLVMLIVFVYPCHAITRSLICRSTSDPSYCNSVLPNQTADSYTFGRYSVRKSISQSQLFSNIVTKYLQTYGSTLSKPQVHALEDCSLLASLNMDYLSTSYQTVNAISTLLDTRKADDVQSFLSAILTNHQTCLEGLEASGCAPSIRNGPIFNDTKLFRVALALVTRAWIPTRMIGTMWRPRKNQFLFGNRSFPFNMFGKTRQDFESVIKSKLPVNVSDIVIVSQDGIGNFSSINEAINVAPNNTDGSNGYFLIYVRAGVYEEYISIAKNKKYLFMMGEGINKTVITGNRSVADGWTTFNSATFGMPSKFFVNTVFVSQANCFINVAAVVSPNFVMMDMTIRNTAGAIKHQGVALRSGADLSTFYRCSFEGYQDTLYTHSLRQFYRECDIYGTVDFIFGNAAVVLQNCNIYPRLPMSGQFNAITAQGRTDPNQNTGTSIHNCKIKAADDLANSTDQKVETYLGRPWKEYSRTVVMQSFMDDLINPAGWHIWSGDFALNTSYYAEYNNTGPGSDTSNRVTWPGYHVIDSAEASNFTVSNFLVGDSWLPKTGVSYTGGLV